MRISAARQDELAVADSRGRRLSHRQLASTAEEFGAVLCRGGVGPGDAVLLQLPNWVEWQAAFLAVLRIGAIPATIPVRTDATQLLYVAELIGARLLVTAEDGGSGDLAASAIGVATRCKHALDVLLLSTTGTLRPAHFGQGAAPERSKYTDLDHLMFTSSTTGRPKAVIHTADTLAALNHTFSERFGLDANSPVFMASPLGHSVGAMHGARLSLFNASPLVLQERWDPENALAMVDEYRCAFTAAATPFLMDLLRAPRRGGQEKLAPMRWFLCGGAPVPPSLMDQTREEFPRTRVTVLWGMTEGGVTTCVSDSPWPKVRSTCGIGLPGLETRILGANGETLPANAEGELVMRGPGVFTGYVGQDDLYASYLTPDGFFRTDDQATMDDEGYIRITGRIKDLIIRGGVNISPVPIEDALAAHPNVASVAVVGVPDERLGERICAVIEPRVRHPDLEELVKFALLRGLPKYHCPEFLHIMDAMPRTPAGKIRKLEVKAIATRAVESGGPPS